MSLTINTKKYLIILEDLEEDLNDMAMGASVLCNSALYKKLDNMAADVKQSRQGIKNAIEADIQDNFDESNRETGKILKMLVPDAVSLAQMK